MKQHQHLLCLIQIIRKLKFSKEKFKQKVGRFIRTGSVTTKVFSVPVRARRVQEVLGPDPMGSSLGPNGL